MRDFEFWITQTSFSASSLSFFQRGLVYPLRLSKTSLDLVLDWMTNPGREKGRGLACSRKDLPERGSSVSPFSWCPPLQATISMSHELGRRSTSTRSCYARQRLLQQLLRSLVRGLYAFATVDIFLTIHSLLHGWSPKFASSESIVTTLSMQLMMYMPGR